MYLLKSPKTNYRIRTSQEGNKHIHTNLDKRQKKSVESSVDICIRRLGRFPYLASWNEFAATPMKAPLDGPIMRAAYRG
jgi:hypothetical protein